MRTTVNLPEPLLRNAKKQAASRGVAVSVVIEDALRAHLARPETRRPSAFRLHTVRGRLKDPSIDLDRTSALLTGEDKERYSG